MFQPWKTRYQILTVVVLLLLLSGLSWAADAPSLKMQETETLQMIRGQAMVFKGFEQIKRVSVADPNIADFILISPTEIYITGKAVGTTNLTMWINKKHYRVYNIVVSIDISQLKKDLHEIMPDENDLRITSGNGRVNLYGKVSNIANLNQVLAITEAYISKGKINNLLEVGSVHQVMLEVKVAEMQRSLMKRIGINFGYLTDSGHFGINKLAGLTSFTSAGDSILESSVSSAVNALFSFRAGGMDWAVFMNALKSDGLINILAEPTLIALSGEEASFLAGGEFPIPAPQGLGSVSIDYKSFGVGVTFKPIVLGDGKINIDVTSEVSELDFSTALQVSGYVVPGLTTRRAKTVIQLADGQSFAIAGLLKETTRDTVDKFPILGDLPILGALFRSRSWQTNETELVIIVTPHLVKPLDMDEQTLPLDSYEAPDDLEFYLLGHMKDEEPVEETVLTGELDGDFGHAIPGVE